VEEKRGVWTVGPNETMKARRRSSEPGETSENFFTLAERCLREELALETDDYGPVSISWIGLSASNLQVKIFAQVVGRLSRDDMLAKFDSAEAVYEADRCVWLPFRNEVLAEIAADWRRDKEGRTWSDSAPLSVAELWRMRRTLIK
jgi:hypothetical protein